MLHFNRECLAKKKKKKEYLIFNEISIYIYIYVCVLFLRSHTGSILDQFPVDSHASGLFPAITNPREHLNTQVQP